EELKIIFEEIYKNFNVNKNAEITIESNPGTLNIEKLQTMLECGVNRLSIGLQSTFDKHLKYIGRIHTFEEFLKNYSEARNCGFSNINIDLMYSLPNQTMEEWKETLETVVKLNPEHISAYSLILEEGTELYEMESKNEFQLNDEEIDIQMYRYTINFLQKHGYNQYEISNYAKSRCNQNEASNYTKSRYNQNEASNYSKSKCKQYKIPNCEKQDNKYKSFECEHNKGYWKCEEYIGVGAGSSGFIGDVRYNNVCDLETYHNMIKKGIKPIENKDILTEKDFIEEKIFMGLRMNEGIYFDEFEKKFKINFAEVYKNEIEKLSKQNLIEIIYDKKSIAGIKLTQTGREISNTVFVEFLR
ncbi:MAG: radical SAM protein, partial [Clostridioides sp.]|nr:radical SAM protein [Clostridioides sp.]